MNEKEIRAAIRRSYGESYEVHEEMIMSVVGPLIVERDLADYALDEQRQRAERLNRAVEMSKSMIEDWGRKVAERDATIVELHNELNHASDELVKARSERDAKIAALAGQLGELHAERDRLREKLDDRRIKAHEDWQAEKNRRLDAEKARREVEVELDRLREAVARVRKLANERDAIVHVGEILIALDGTEDK